MIVLRQANGVPGMAAVATSLTHFGESAAVRPGIRCFIAADILLPLNGLLIAVFLGWVWARAHAPAARHAEGEGYLAAS